MPEFETDRNLLFGVIALQSDLINSYQFVDACTLWSSRKSLSMADVLVQQKWLTDEDRRHVEYLLARRLEKLSESSRPTLAKLPVEHRSGLTGNDDPKIHDSRQGLNSKHDTTGAIGVEASLPAGPGGPQGAAFHRWNRAGVACLRFGAAAGNRPEGAAG